MLIQRNMEERLERLEQSLKELHAKVDLLLGHERWVHSVRTRLHDYGIVHEDTSRPDALSVLGDMVVRRLSTNEIPRPRRLRHHVFDNPPDSSKSYEK